MRPYWDLRTRKYHSHSSRTCFSVYPFSTIRATTNVAKQIGYTNASVTAADDKETKVGKDPWYTAVLKLTASKMAVPKELWVEDAAITAEKDAKALKKLQRFRKAYDDIVEHEKAHMTVAFDWLKKDALGFDSAWGTSEAKMPTNGVFTSRTRKPAFCATALITSTSKPTICFWAFS